MAAVPRERSVGGTKIYGLGLGGGVRMVMRVLCFSYEFWTNAEVASISIVLVTSL